MPAAITHFLHGKEVLQQLEEKKTPPTINALAFFWGAQGPDFFFCHRFLPWMRGKHLRELGEKFHSCNPNELLSFMKQYAWKRKEPTVISYCLGFLCHYAYDSVAHPYINWLANRLLKDFSMETPETLHTEIESALDTIMLRTKEGKLPTSLNLKQYFPHNTAVQAEIAEIYSYLIQEMFGLQVGPREILTATEDAHKVFSLLSDRTSLKKMLITKFESHGPHRISAHIRPMMENSEIDYANIGNAPWFLPSGEESCCTFFDLEKKAKQKALRLTEGFLKDDAATFSAEFFSTLTGDEPFG